jgi:hypothetical protein
MRKSRPINISKKYENHVFFVEKGRGGSIQRGTLVNKLFFDTLFPTEGMDQTYQKELLGNHGFACKVVPEYSERTQKTYRGCLHRRGTKRFPVKAQSIVPASHYFKVILQ